MVLGNLPEKLAKQLMPFQRDGVKFAVEKHGRCLIADEMGLGKTLQAISVAYYYKREWPLLIIVPSSLRYSWIEEFEKWLPDINPRDINLVQSGSDVSDIGTAQVTITTFGLLSKGTSRILREALMNQGFHVVIVDESHYIRNSKTVSAKTVVPLIKNANRRILLSGTPALSRPVELYPQIDAVCPNEFGTWWSYTARYCDARLEWFGKGKRRNVNGASNLEELQQRLSDKLMIRREKSQVLTQLPPKQRQRVLFELKDSELKKEIRQTFDELRPLMKRSNQDNFEVLTGGGEHDVKDTNTLSLIQRLYRLSGTAKIGPAKEYVEMLCDNPKLKFLVFAYHHDMMNGLSESLHDKKIRFIRIDGETPPSERPHLVHQFQSDPGTRVAVLSILAAGVGLTFTAATVVVFAEMYWTPGTMVQCEDRAHRIGQTSCVAVHYLVAKDTMDEWVWSAVCRKTIVTSTTLTGRKRKMEALEGDRYQVDVLSNADAWIPTSNSENSNLTQYFETTLDSSQKSILQFFSPKQQSDRKKIKDQQGSSFIDSLEVERGVKARETTNTEENAEEESYSDQNCSTPASKRIKIDSNFVCKSNDKSSVKKKYLEGKENAIVIDSDEDDDFIEKRSAVKSHGKSMSSSKKRKRTKLEKSIVSPKYSLESVFEKVKKKEHLKENVNVSDNEVTPVKVLENASANSGTKQKSRNDRDECSEVTEVAGLNKNEWHCSECTYLNHRDIKYCEMCETPKKCRALSRSHTSHNSDNIQNNPLKHGTRTKLSEKKNENVLGETEEKVTDNGNDSHIKSATRITMESKDEEGGAYYIDDDIDYDPGSDPQCDGNTEDAAESDEMEPETDKNDYSIDEYCSAESNDSREINNEDEQLIPLGGKIQIENKESSSNFNNTGSKECKDLCKGLVSWSGTVDEESECSMADQSETDQSQYFQNTLSSSPAPVRLKRKEVQIENNLMSKGKDTPQSECANVTSNKQTVDTQESVTGTPTSSKKYRFRSVSKNKDLSNSPVVPSACLGNEIAQNADRSEKGSDTDKIEDSAEDKEKCKNVDKCGVDFDDTGKPSVRECSKLGAVKAGNVMEVEIDAVSTPKTGQDFSFSSPEIDEMLAAETDDVTADVTKRVDEDKRMVDLDSVPVYSMFKYQCSKYTDRIYLLTQDEDALNLNFIPTDVQVGNDDGLPDVLLHPDNLRLVQRFVREWQSLTETKRRLIVKSGQPFTSPLLQYEKLRSCKTVNTQRHKTKVDTSVAAHQKAKDINGTVRLLSKYSGVHDENSGEKGIAQTVTEDGTPLCLQCFQPFSNALVTKASIQDENNAWNTRFCSRKCSQEYWMVCNNDYIRDQVFEAEHGICQLCKFDAHSVFRHVRDTTDQRKRAEIIARSKFNSLTVKVKEQMVRKPAAGQYWHVDHIVPVWEGGGQCDIDNLRTLCIICHQKVTARQAAKRATVRKLGTAVNSGDISAFFQRN